MVKISKTIALCTFILKIFLLSEEAYNNTNHSAGNNNRCGIIQLPKKPLY